MKAIASANTNVNVKTVDNTFFILVTSVFFIKISFEFGIKKRAHSNELSGIFRVHLLKTSFRLGDGKRV